jgi:hypothetical protein
MQTSRYRLRDSKVAWRKWGDEGTLIDLTLGRVHTCNAAATVIVECLVAGASVEELTSAVTAAFDVDAERARADVIRVLAAFDDERIVDAHDVS